MFIKIKKMQERINIFLDLDQTIISGEVLKDEDDDDEIYDIESNKTKAINFNFHNMENYYVIFERPGLQKFLDYLFKNFNVSIWTAASKDYGLFIAEKFILKGHPERKLDFMFFSYHCDLSENIGKVTKMFEQGIANKAFPDITLEYYKSFDILDPNAVKNPKKQQKNRFWFR
jgi:hypothetical protein